MFVVLSLSLSLSLFSLSSLSLSLSLSLSPLSLSLSLSVYNVSVPQGIENQSLLLERLNNGQEYMVWIRAMTAAGPGPNSTMLIKTQDLEHSSTVPATDTSYHKKVIRSWWCLKHIILVPCIRY